MQLRTAGIVQDSIVDGPGLRFVVFAQGCPHRCEGCHNPHTHDFGGGTLMEVEGIYAQIRRNPLIQGLTLSGGEPFCQPAPLARLCGLAKADGMHVIAYSGYTFEELVELSREDADIAELLALCDILVDGRFDISKRNLMLKFRGSENQRVLDVKASLAEGKAVETAI